MGDVLRDTGPYGGLKVRGSGGACMNRTRNVKYLLPHPLLELFPQTVRPTRQRHVLRTLSERKANDPRQTVGRPHFIGDGKPFQPEDPKSTACQLINGGATHPAYANDDNVIDPVIPHRDSFRQRSINGISSIRVDYLDQSAGL